nr:unnamed protein product [Digitaria exilis]
MEKGAEHHCEGRRGAVVGARSAARRRLGLQISELESTAKPTSSLLLLPRHGLRYEELELETFTGDM